MYYDAIRMLNIQVFDIWVVYFFQVSILPPLASIFMTGIAAQLADNLIAKGVQTTTVWSHYEQLIMVPQMSNLLQSCIFATNRRKSVSLP